MPPPYVLPLELESQIVLGLSDPRDIVSYCNANPRNELCVEKNGFLWKRVSERLQLPHDNSTTYKDEILQWIRDIIDLRNVYIAHFSRSTQMDAQTLVSIDRLTWEMRQRFPDDVILMGCDRREEILVRMISLNPWPDAELDQFAEHETRRGVRMPLIIDLVDYIQEHPDGGNYSAPDSRLWHTLYWRLFTWALPPGKSYKDVITFLIGDLVLEELWQFDTADLIYFVFLEPFTENDWNATNRLIDKMLILWPNRAELHIMKSVHIRRPPNSQRPLTTTRQFRLWGQRRGQAGAGQ